MVSILINIHSINLTHRVVMYPVQEASNLSSASL